MQLTEHCELADPRKPARMIVLRHLFTTGGQVDVECIQNVFNVPFQIVEVNLSLRIMDGLCSQSTCTGQNEPSLFRISAVYLADFVKMKIANTAIDVPLNRAQHGRN